MPPPQLNAGTVPPSSGPYYRDRYWNELGGVVLYLQQRATGDAGTNWIDHLAAWRGGPFRKALVLNCGNGWVERAMVERGVVTEAVGVDIGRDLLALAAAAAGDLPIRYHHLDVNTAAFPEDGYDLVVNHAAAHHVAYIDRVFRALARLLPPDGVLVSWDYVGPHRNQYPGGAWEAAHRVNVELPQHLRSPMHYPSLAAMLVEDPTEAIHSELVLPVLHRYFEVLHERALGGAIAYPVLTQNERFVDAPAAETEPWLARILAADAAYTDADPARTLFAYAIARPWPADRVDAAPLAAWTAEEEERERDAAGAGGRYYPPTALAAAIDQSAIDAVALMPPSRAWRAAAASTMRRIGTRLPPSVRERLGANVALRRAWRRIVA